MSAVSPSFSNPDELVALISSYFKYIAGVPEKTVATGQVETAKAVIKQAWKREPEPPTITGLALFLGFNSRKEYELFERKRKFAKALKRGRLLIEAAYEKKLHQQPASGAIFALKNMGWNEQPEVRPRTRVGSKNIRVEIVEAGPVPAGNEKEVSL